MAEGPRLTSWLRDGLEIGPGLVERWESNADASSWPYYSHGGDAKYLGGRQPRAALARGHQRAAD
jgi:hypothetical protein